eukprot:maker-scaffold_16-snap-gene-3.13-mRNA-1 protein AED:0.00 eAED:0.00 QI:161/1/1/1/1/1/2/496/74
MSSVIERLPTASEIDQYQASLKNIKSNKISTGKVCDSITKEVNGKFTSDPLASGKTADNPYLNRTGGPKCLPCL